MRTIAAICLIAAVAALSACGADNAAPELRQIRPAPVEPGALVMLSGERMDRIATVTIGGLPASDLTVVNAGLLTAVTPPNIAPGPQALELRATDGRTVYGAVTIAALSAGPQLAAQPVTVTPSQSPAPSAGPSPSPTPTPTPSRAPTAPPTREKDDDKQHGKPDQRPSPGRGRGR